jgi:pimeloyl-ACP methyl ester carboxylesterase
MIKQRSERLGGIHVRVHSPEGTPRGAVVLVHGVCMSGKVWGRWAERLASRGVELWCPDLRGHGESEGRENVGSFHVEDYVADVERVIEASSAQAIVGHDMGGLVAQLVATRRELRGMVLVNTVAPRGLSGTGNVLALWRELRPRYVRAVVQGSAWTPTEGDLDAFTAGKLPPEDRAEVLSWLGPESGVAAREMSLAGVSVDEKKIRCAAFVVASTFDGFTPPARQRQVASRYRADYVEFAQHAHFPMVEPGWERPVAVIGRWLDEAARLGENRNSMGRMAAARRSATSSPLPIPPGTTPTPPPASVDPAVVAAAAAASPPAPLPSPAPAGDTGTKKDGS